VSYDGVAPARESLLDALGRVSERLGDDQACRVYPEYTAAVDPFGLVLGPPTFQWDDTPGTEPLRASWPIHLVAPAGGDVLGALLEILPAVTRELDGMRDVTVVSATPDVFRAGGDELPAYLIVTEVDL
jgi:hypothetical protein